jgi:hypothetical protein
MSTYIYAQNLDNTSPDHLYIEMRKIPYDIEYPPGAESTEFMNELARRKDSLRTFTYKGLRVSYSTTLFLIQIQSEEEDSVGRNGVVVLSGDLEALEQPQKLISQLDHFLTEISWSAPVPTEMVLESILKEIKQRLLHNKRKRTSMHILAFLGGAIALAFVFKFFQCRSIERCFP